MCSSERPVSSSDGEQVQEPLLYKDAHLLVPLGEGRSAPLTGTRLLLTELQGSVLAWVPFPFPP